MLLPHPKPSFTDKLLRVIWQGYFHLLLLVIRTSHCDEVLQLFRRLRVIYLLLQNLFSQSFVVVKHVNVFFEPRIYFFDGIMSLPHRLHMAKPSIKLCLNHHLPRPFPTHFIYWTVSQREMLFGVFIVFEESWFLDGLTGVGVFGFMGFVGSIGFAVSSSKLFLTELFWAGAVVENLLAYILIDTNIFRTLERHRVRTFMVIELHWCLSIDCRSVKSNFGLV